MPPPETYAVNPLERYRDQWHYEYSGATGTTAKYRACCVTCAEGGVLYVGLHGAYYHLECLTGLASGRLRITGEHGDSYRNEAAAFLATHGLCMAVHAPMGLQPYDTDAPEDWAWFSACADTVRRR